jgi:hypothetical protein
MWARTVSTWMMGTAGTEAPKLMVRKLSPAPNTSTQSAWSIMRRPIVWENDPRMPRLYGWPWNMSLPRAEVISRAPIFSAKACNASFAPAR